MRSKAIYGRRVYLGGSLFPQGTLYPQGTEYSLVWYLYYLYMLCSNCYGYTIYIGVIVNVFLHHLLLVSRVIAFWHLSHQPPLKDGLSQTIL
jgi:hypothetical protein